MEEHRIQGGFAGLRYEHFVWGKNKKNAQQELGVFW